MRSGVTLEILLAPVVEDEDEHDEPDDDADDDPDRHRDQQPWEK